MPRTTRYDLACAVFQSNMQAVYRVSVQGTATQWLTYKPFHVRYGWQQRIRSRDSASKNPLPDSPLTRCGPEIHGMTHECIKNKSA